jgi:hypothetical protein
MSIWRNTKRGRKGELNGIALDPKEILLNDELLLSRVVSREAIIRLLVEKGIFTKEEFPEMAGVVNLEIAGRVHGRKTTTVLQVC